MDNGLEISVAGLNMVPEYTKVAEKFAPLLVNGVAVEADIIPEPDNKYDPKALAVYLYSLAQDAPSELRMPQQVGYVPKKMAPCLAEHLFTAGGSGSCVSIKSGVDGWGSSDGREYWVAKILLPPQYLKQHA